MALPPCVLSELLEAFRAGEGVDLLRDSVRVALQELIELEATERIGAGPYERTEERTNERNGYRHLALTTRAGDVELRIPKLREGSVMPVILEPRRRIDQALCAVVMEAYVHGVSTRSVDDLVEAVGGTGISTPQVSRICEGLDEAVGAFRTRIPTHMEFPYLLAYVPKGQADYVATAFRMIFAQPTAAGVHAAWNKTRDELAARFPQDRPLMEAAKSEVLALTTFPREHRRKIWST